jgi:hypothetical protein
MFTTSSRQVIPEESVDGQDWDCLRGRDVTDDVVAAALSPDEDDSDAEVAAALSPVKMEDWLGRCLIYLRYSLSTDGLFGL